MKRIILILAILGCFLLQNSAPIDAVTIGFPMETVTLSPTDNDLSVPAGKEIYGYSLFATNDSAMFIFYDAATVAAGETATPAVSVIDEGGEATAFETVTVWYPKPLETDNGLSVHVQYGNITIYYEK